MIDLTRPYKEVIRWDGERLLRMYVLVDSSQEIVSDEAMNSTKSPFRFEPVSSLRGKDKKR